MDKITCMSWVDDPGDTPERYWEINIDGKVWPCCHYVVESYQIPENGGNRKRSKLERPKFP